MSARGVRPGAGLILLLGLLEAFGPLSMDLYMPALPALAESLHTSDTLAQVTMSVCMLGLALGQLVAGPMSDRFGRRVPLLVGVLVFTVFSAACAFAPSVAWLIAFRFVQGLGGAAGMVVTLAIARDLFSGRELAKMLSWLALVGATAPIIAPVLGGQLVRIMEWRGIFGVLTGIGALLFLAALLWLPESHPRAKRSEGGARTLRDDAAALLRPGAYRVILAIASVTGIAFFSYLSMSSFALQGSYGVSPQAFGLLFALGSVCNVIGSQTNRVLVARFSTEQLYGAGLVIGWCGGVLASASALAGWGLAPFCAGLGLYLLSTGFTLPNANAIALTEHGERAGSAAALLGMSALVVGPIVSPLVSTLGMTPQVLGLTMVTASTVVLVIASLALWPRRSAPGA
ncbi:multidrug effflux MFS transporter [Leucobacter sp. UCMA 4100]|uniref:multidrug effflux MFS transporter n=1 Tax=Leucobacter sp. UCMA 4100 TaxID=2810534 RepID=UPI0022EB55F4|nr:multidrug effflux MFS transporter [Leucobacter sp. UCMA 4100]